MEKFHGNIAAPLGGSPFYSIGEIDDDELINEDTCVDVGDDVPDKVEHALEERIVEAAKDGFSETWEKNLSKAIQKLKSVLRLRLGSGETTQATPMEIRPDKTKPP